MHSAMRVGLESGGQSQQPRCASQGFMRAIERHTMLSSVDFKVDGLANVELAVCKACDSLETPADPLELASSPTITEPDILKLAYRA